MSGGRSVGFLLALVLVCVTSMTSGNSVVADECDNHVKLCSSIRDCMSCISQSFCGWCSNPLEGHDACLPVDTTSADEVCPSVAASCPHAEVDFYNIGRENPNKRMCTAYECSVDKDIEGVHCNNPNIDNRDTCTSCLSRSKTTANKNLQCGFLTSVQQCIPATITGAHSCDGVLETEAQHASPFIGLGTVDKCSWNSRTEGMIATWTFFQVLVMLLTVSAIFYAAVSQFFCPHLHFTSCQSNVCSGCKCKPLRYKGPCPYTPPQAARDPHYFFRPEFADGGVVRDDNLRDLSFESTGSFRLKSDTSSVHSRTKKGSANMEDSIELNSHDSNSHGHRGEDGDNTNISANENNRLLMAWGVPTRTYLSPHFYIGAFLVCAFGAIAFVLTVDPCGHVDESLYECGWIYPFVWSFLPLSLASVALWISLQQFEGASTIEVMWEFNKPLDAAYLYERKMLPLAFPRPLQQRYIEYDLVNKEADGSYWEQAKVLQEQNFGFSEWRLPVLQLSLIRRVRTVFRMEFQNNRFVYAVCLDYLIDGVHGSKIFLHPFYATVKEKCDELGKTLATFLHVPFSLRCDNEFNVDPMQSGSTVRIDADFKASDESSTNAANFPGNSSSSSSISTGLLTEEFGGDAVGHHASGGLLSGEDDTLE